MGEAMKKLKLVARDADDMKVLSACRQDSVMKVADMAHLSQARRFVLMVNRYCWENDTQPRRARAGLQFIGVDKVQLKHIHQPRGDGVLELLAVELVAADATAGAFRLMFSGAAARHCASTAFEATLAEARDASPPLTQSAHAIAHEPTNTLLSTPPV